MHCASCNANAQLTAKAPIVHDCRGRGGRRRGRGRGRRRRRRRRPQTSSWIAVLRELLSDTSKRLNDREMGMRRGRREW
eukprot:6674385-Pyramimonas_sp.AAC.1